MTNQAIDTLTRAAVLRERYNRRVYVQVLNLLLAAEAKLLAQLESRLEGLTGADRARFQRDDWQSKRLMAVRESIQNLAIRYRTVLNTEIRLGARDLIAAETQAALSVANGFQLSATLTGVSEYQIYTAALSQPFNGMHLKSYMSGFEQGVRRRALQSLRTSFANGDSVPDAIKALRGTKAKGYRDGVLNVSRRSAEMIVRTSMTHMAARTHESIYADLGVGKVEFLSVLDGRTSDICQGLSRKVFDISKPHPVPPMHLNCRSALMPVIEGVKDTGQQTARGPSGKTGLVDSSLNYGQWLKRQPRSFIDEALGKTKAKLFMEGGLKLDKFIDPKWRRTYTISELRQKYSDAFTKAAA